MNRIIRRQRGMTFLGMLCILVPVGLVAYAVIRLVPVYLNYLSISRTLDVTATEMKGDNPDTGAIRRTLERHWQIEDPSALDVKDVEITKDNNGVSIRAVYDHNVPYISNVSLSVHFDKTVKVK
ncbi:MAG TPA: DUF4845 domain-containing protein [Steroidobacteraceae bacterium]|jgi:hypothetical protein|nr:DUF4845 domain-containing protein [Steroidobacteraceae bacterium]